MRFSLATATAFLFVSASAAQAQLFGGPTLHAVSGKPVKISQAGSTNPDCSTNGSVEIRVTRPPEHGRVFISSRRVFANFAPSDNRHHCNRRRIIGLQISYVSARGYTGPDSLTYELIWPHGQLRSQTVSIMVR